MAEQMQDIKRRIKSIGSTERITNAMKLVSAAKLRRAKAVYEHSRMFLNRIIESIDEAYDNGASVPEDYLLGSREIKTTCYVVITSSTGLCGSFNGNIIREVEEEIKATDSRPVLVTIGSKGREHFVRQSVEVLFPHDESADSLQFQDIKALTEPLIEKYHNKEIDEIRLVYTSYINTLKQEPVSRRILPVDMNEHQSSAQTSMAMMEYEPSADAVFDYLASKYLELALYSAAIESSTCEHAARRQAMENASDNASDMLSALQLKYNRARQSQITDEIIEIVSGSEAQA